MSALTLSGPLSAHLAQRQPVSTLPSLRCWAGESHTEAALGASRVSMSRAVASVARSSSLQAVSEQTAQEPDIRTVLEQGKLGTLLFVCSPSTGEAWTGQTGWFAAVRNSSNTDAENRYREGSEYLRSLGFNSSADILRILDVAMVGICPPPLARLRASTQPWHSHQCTISILCISPLDA